MILQVFFICHTCQHFNRQGLNALGMPMSEVRQVEFESLTDASNHIIKYPNHEVVAETREH